MPWWCTTGSPAPRASCRGSTGKLTCLGHLGADVTVEEGREAAAVCALNALAVLEAELGSLDRIARVLTVTGFVASAPDFHEQPAVIDGASKVLADVFGEAGRHTRSAIGVAALPRRWCGRDRSDGRPQGLTKDACMAARAAPASSQ